MKRFILVIATSLAAAACGGGKFDEAAVRARASEALMPFKKSLRQTLLGALAKGPESAIEACALQAPELARSAAHDGIVVGRTSLRLRNPANTVPAWAEAALPSLTSARAFDPGLSIVTKNMHPTECRLHALRSIRPLRSRFI